MEKLNLSWLKKARRDRHISIARAAEMLGVAQPTVWRYESGIVPLKVDTLFKLLNAYGVSIVDVVQRVSGGENE